MNATAAIAYSFLKGSKLTIKTAFKEFGCSNLPRECGRSIERKFGVRLHRERREGKSRYGVACTWFEYKLPDNPENRPGRIKMKKYVSDKIGHAKTMAEATILKNLTLL